MCSQVTLASSEGNEFSVSKIRSPQYNQSLNFSTQRPCSLIALLFTSHYSSYNNKYNSASLELLVYCEFKVG